MIVVSSLIVTKQKEISKNTKHNTKVILYSGFIVIVPTINNTLTKNIISSMFLLFIWLQYILKKSSFDLLCISLNLKLFNFFNILFCFLLILHIPPYSANMYLYFPSSFLSLLRYTSVLLPSNNLYIPLTCWSPIIPNLITFFISVRYM